MKRLSSCNLLSALLVLILFGLSCKHGISGIGPLPDERGVQLDVFNTVGRSHGLITGASVGFEVIVFAGDSDTAIPWKDLVTRVEVNPGDGAGWLDFTEGYLSPMYPPYHNGTHVYNEPGNYTVQTRVTYWDAEVLLDDELGERVIKVLPAENDG